ncbi:MAG: hypothetical protein BWY70_01667 [Bacteroidetes bacterium ADurb.Bin408]|nr:MAG: hypothetical protein BWY70_01667 [Bacteroidetes bacterium ADurb.Bin408]
MATVATSLAVIMAFMQKLKGMLMLVLLGAYMVMPQEQQVQDMVFMVRHQILVVQLLMVFMELLTGLLPIMAYIVQVMVFTPAHGLNRPTSN